MLTWNSLGKSLWKSSLSILAVAIGAGVAAGHAHAQSIGTVGAVNVDAEGAAPGAGARPLVVGNAVVQNERIRTDANGTAHIMFNDRSALNVGRNSSIVIDSFVYDGGAGAGSQIVTLAQGAARFVGGQISHSSGATIKTPAASIGVRGGNVSVLQGAGGATIMVHNGVATVTTGAGSRTVLTGYQLSVDSGGGFGDATRISLERLREINRMLASHGRQTGGAKRKPTTSEAARHDIGNVRAPVQTPTIDAIPDDTVRSKTNSARTPVIIQPTPTRRVTTP